MKAVQISRYGGSEVVEIKQNAPFPFTPKPLPDKILIGIKAAGVNPVDWKIREGHMQQMMHTQFPLTLGMDFSGVVQQAGEEGENLDEVLRQGNEVYGQAAVTSGGSGAFAEMAIANVDSVAPKPKSLNHIEAAALPLAGVSAWQALVENMGLTSGQKILIHGGAGGIGSIAIALAKNLGAFVATTASPDDRQFVAKLGADEVIGYKTQAFEDLVHDCDAVFDTVGGETYSKSFGVLKREGGGIVVSMLELPNNDLMERFGVKAMFQLTQVNRERLAKLAQWVDKNSIKVNVDRTFSIDDAAKALDYVKDVHPRGKVVLTMQ